MVMRARCRQCGGAISGTDALCPECLKRVALKESAEFDEAEGSAVNDLLPEPAQRMTGSRPNPPENTRAGGERWGDYELLEPLGAGAMGRVFKARHLRLNRLVALKRIRQGSLASDGERKRFLREAE